MLSVSHFQLPSACLLPSTCTHVNMCIDAHTHTDTHTYLLIHKHISAHKHMCMYMLMALLSLYLMALRVVNPAALFLTRPSVTPQSPLPALQLSSTNGSSL